MSKKLKLSPWHSGDVKPVHIGVYETPAHDGSKYFSYWDGNHFNGKWSSIERAFSNKYFGEVCRVYNWRGILK